MGPGVNAGGGVRAPCGLPGTGRHPRARERQPRRSIPATQPGAQTFRGAFRREYKTDRNIVDKLHHWRMKFYFIIARFIYDLPKYII